MTLPKAISLISENQPLLVATRQVVGEKKLKNKKQNKNKNKEGQKLVESTLNNPE